MSGMQWEAVAAIEAEGQCDMLGCTTPITVGMVIREGLVTNKGGEVTKVMHYHAKGTCDGITLREAKGMSPADLAARGITLPASTKVAKATPAARQATPRGTVPAAAPAPVVTVATVPDDVPASALVGTAKVENLALLSALGLTLKDLVGLGLTLADVPALVDQAIGTTPATPAEPEPTTQRAATQRRRQAKATGQ
jgi:hypothetical protein